MGSSSLKVSLFPRWGRLYLGYERRTPNHPGKRTLLRLLLRAVARLRPQPFAWRMENGAVLAISPLEGLAFAWTVGWTCFQTGRWEAHVERCLRELLRPGDAALDVGANLGYFTAVMAQSVGPGGSVTSFEPVPPTFDRLRAAVRLNRFEQVTPLPFALGDADGTAQISFDPHFSGSASFHGDARAAGSESHVIRVRRLDDLVASGEISPPDLIKLDVEGHELAVIRGALETIAHARPRIIFEFSPALADRGGWTLLELGQALASCGAYRFFEIREEALDPIPNLATYAPEVGGYGADLLAMPACEPSQAAPGSEPTCRAARSTNLA